MEDQVFIESELSPSIKRTWSWRHREGASGGNSGDTDIALELLSLEAEQKGDYTGLSSQDGYKRLFEVIRQELDAFSRGCVPGWKKDFWTTLQCQHHSSVSWISILFFFFEVFALLFTHGSLSSQGSSHFVVEGIIVLLISLFNVILCVREENLRRTEIYRCTKQILGSCRDYCGWSPPDYVDPCTPSSPSISLVDTYRDGELIKMPCNLLVYGDVIVLGPSQTAPANVQIIDTSPDGEFMEGSLILLKGQLYKPDEPSKVISSNLCDDEPETALPCPTLPRKLFVVKEAPFKSTLSNLLESSPNKPISLLENEKHFIASTVIEKKLLWLFICLSLIVNVARLLILPNKSGHWSEMMFLLQAYTILPILPLSFPLLWISVNLYGASRINILFDKLKEESITNVKVERDFPVSEVLPHLWSTIAGDYSHLPRTANLLQVLGNITVWCCIDRDGILSLPNPSVEKVFFLQSKKSMRQFHNNRFRDRKISSCTWESDISRQTSHDDSNLDDASSSSSSSDDDDVIAEDGTHLKGRAAVLNVSNDPESQFGLRFDDKRWQEYLNSLKPLGLNILLNSSCSCPTRAMRFSDHTAFLSLARNSTPVFTPQRCLCLLGKEIGFTETALSVFTKQQYVFVVHPLESQIAECPLQSSSYLAVCKERPVPCMTCLVVKEHHTGSHQLLTQGSPDLVLDACSDFWDGSSLNAISSHDKKKVLDFYQRNSISSQCVAFAYRPCIESGCNQSTAQSDIFIKLPYAYQWKSCESMDESLSDIPEEEKEDKAIEFVTKSVEDIKIGQLLEQVELVDDAEPYHKLVGNQVFIGMVTLQFQAKKDIIPLVEDLNTAGVRFVHFSPEDELKSRVFAERMGLETGWNCHISLADTKSPGQRPKTDSSCYQPSAGDDDELHDIMHDGPEKHVSWIDIKMQDSIEQVNKTDTSEVDDHHNKTETSTLLGEEQQQEANEDYWFFYNRAKLPRGVNNIRPHLENVDNVPLLVPLFTDCRPSAVQEMITIMQEHGEVVCCVGSSFNVNNTSIFTQADISVAVEPMFPQLCLQGLPKDFRSGTPQLQTGRKNPDKVTFNLTTTSQSSSSDLDNDLSPLELSAFLNSLPCSLSFHRDTDFKFKSLLKEARRLSFGLRKCFTFILACQLMLTITMFLCQCLLLPPPLTGLHLLWLSCITVPLLSLSLIGSKSSKGLMSMMTGKNDRTFKLDIAYPFCMYFSLGFMPTCLFICTALFPLTLYGFCTNSGLGSCHFLLGNGNSSQPWNGYGGTNIQVLSLAQDINAFTIVLFFAVVSTSFVHHLKSLWKRSPFTNIHWLYSVIISVGLQFLYFIISQSIWISSYGAHYTIKDVSPYITAFVFVWPIVTLLFTELIIKRRYIKLYIRFQKRAKLKFGTKLGMNSPF